MILLLAGLNVLLFAIVIALLLHRRRQQANAENDEKVRNLEAIISLANDAILVVDIGNGNILNCNAAAGDLLGYTENELLEKTFFSLQPPELLHKSAVVIADVWEKEGLIFDDIPFVHKNGNLLPVECSAKVAPYARRPAAVIYARDISERLRLQNEIKTQSDLIAQKNHDMLDSINYAKRIQQSILPDEAIFRDFFADHFIYYRPKDIVSGDFYFAEPILDKNGREHFAIAVADCTGHGVPGAFMSLLGASILHQSLTEEAVRNSAHVLDYLNTRLSSILKQREDNVIRDGMDISFCVYDPHEMKVYYAGANNGIYHLGKNGLSKLSPDKQPIGFHDNQKPFNLQELAVEKGDMLFLYTDGFADQFGGPKGKKFKYAAKESLLKEGVEKSCIEQKVTLSDAFENWIAHRSEDGLVTEFEQIDDVTIIGLRI